MTLYELARRAVNYFLSFNTDDNEEGVIDYYIRYYRLNDLQSRAFRDMFWRMLNRAVA